MGDYDWFDWQARTLFARFEHFAEVLRFQLSIADALLEDAQAWFSASCANAGIFPTDATETNYSAPKAPESSSPLSSSELKEVGLRSIDEITADAQKALAQSYREAFDAGRNHSASELKRRMAAMFEGLIESDVGQGGDSSATHSDGRSPDPDHTGK
jgi:hypothetical protein